MQTKLNVQFDYISLKIMFAKRDWWTLTMRRTGEKLSMHMETIELDEPAVLSAFDSFGKLMTATKDPKATFDSIVAALESKTTQAEVAEVLKSL